MLLYNNAKNYWLIDRSGLINMINYWLIGQGTKILNITQGGKVISGLNRTANVVTVNPKTLQLTAVKSGTGGTGIMAKMFMFIYFHSDIWFQKYIQLFMWFTAQLKPFVRFCPDFVRLFSTQHKTIENAFVVDLF